MNDQRYDAAGFGELLLRLTPPNREKLAFSDSLLKSAGGAECNVMAGLAMLGMRTTMLSKMPDNEITRFICRQMRACGVDDSNLAYDCSPEGRVGIYYYEQGVTPRKPSVVYDRKFSSINRVSAKDFSTDLFSQAKLFHVSGISLAIGEQSKQTVLDLMQAFREQGAWISFDVNYRANLWSEQQARETITNLLPLVDILFISEESSRRMFQKNGKFREIMKSYCSDYGVKLVVSTERKVITPSEHSFSSTVYQAQSDQFYTESPYERIEALDRIGSGDAFVAGALFGWLKYRDPQKMVAFGNAMAAAKNTVFGDLPQTSFSEISRLIQAHHEQGIQSEMDR